MYIACVYSAVGCQNGRNQRAHRTLHHPFKSSSVNLRWLQSKSSKVWQNGNFGNILCWSGSKMCHNVPDAARCCQILELSAFFSRTNCASQDDAAKRQLAAKEPHGFEAEIDGSWSDIVFFKMFN